MLKYKHQYLLQGKGVKRGCRIHTGSRKGVKFETSPFSPYNYTPDIEKPAENKFEAKKGNSLNSLFQKPFLFNYFPILVHCHFIILTHPHFFISSIFHSCHPLVLLFFWNSFFYSSSFLTFFLFILPFTPQAPLSSFDLWKFSSLFLLFSFNFANRIVFFLLFWKFFLFLFIFL